MKIRICPNCQTHNSSSAWSCSNCGQTLSIDTVVELADDQVEISGEALKNDSPESEPDGDNLDSPGSEPREDQSSDYYSPEKKQLEPVYRERPGCLTAYAAFAIAAGIMGVFSVGISLFTIPFADSAGVIFLSLLIPALAIATGFGVWYMKKWAWWLVLITQSLNVIFSLFILTQNPVGLAILVIPGILLYWFLMNRHLFEDDYLPVESGRKNTGLIILAVLAIPLTVVCIIVFFTLLGPSIGNVFTNIMNSLEP